MAQTTKKDINANNYLMKNHLLEVLILGVEEVVR